MSAAALRAVETKPSILTIVWDGLRGNIKRLPSWLLYDAIGSDLFVEITEQPEYQQTNWEIQILRDSVAQIVKLIGAKPTIFYEFGAGQFGPKQRILFGTFKANQMNVCYAPIDICAESVNYTISEARKFDRTIHAVGMVAEYTQAFADIRAHREFGPQAQFFFFPGANIGNFSDKDALEFMTSVSELMGPEDLFMVGFDLMKDIAEMQPAYDDAAGVTARFNLNLLTRLNRECGANFDLSHFVHHPFYDPERRAMVSWIISTKDQTVTFADMPGFAVHFKQGEGILVEQSRKCTMEEIYELGRAAGLTVREVFTNGSFADVVFVRE